MEGTLNHNVDFRRWVHRAMRCEAETWKMGQCFSWSGARVLRLNQHVISHDEISLRLILPRLRPTLRRRMAI